MNIGFFDSGMGGLTVLRESLQVLPHENYLYFADSLNAPYGDKSRKALQVLIEDAVAFIAKQDIKALVVACNTATSVAIKDLRKQYTFPIIGMEPAVKPAVITTFNKRILVFATNLTLKEEKFKKLVAKVDTQNQVDYLPLQELVVFAENFQFDPKIILPYLQSKLASFDLEQYETIVLGCTHFPYFIPFIRKVVPAHIQIIDGNNGTIRHLRNQLLNIKKEGKPKFTFFISKQPASPKKFQPYLQLLDSGDFRF